jgi:hypothetical protein
VPIGRDCSAGERVHVNDHLVEFYETDDLLVESVRDFVAPNLHSREPVILVATPAHRADVIESIGARGHDIETARRNNLFVDLDAEETLDRFMVDGRPDPELFEQFIGGLVRSIGQGNSRLRIYGEMVARLWDQGNQLGALHLESLWNSLSVSHPFTLLCTYPLSSIEWAPDIAPFQGICSTHSSVRIRFAAPLTQPVAESPSVPSDQFARLQGIGSDLTALKEVIRNANQMGRLAENNKTFGPGSEDFDYPLAQ